MENKGAAVAEQPGAEKEAETEEKKELSAEEPEAEERLDAEAGEEKTEEAAGQPEVSTGRNYKIECCRQINESFGGVSFHGGTAYTKDSFTASWFRNKEGYTVSEVQEK